MAVIELNGISKEFKNTGKVLDNINVSFERGDFMELWDLQVRENLHC